MKIAVGIFDPETYVFEPADPRAYEQARARYGQLQATLTEALEIASGDREEVARYLNISDALPDMASFDWAFSNVMSAPYELKFDHYVAYKWLMVVLRTSLSHGDVLYQSRCVLLDKSEPEDWFIAQYL